MNDSSAGILMMVIGIGAAIVFLIIAELGRSK
jgi:hypothetical protein